MLHEVLMSISLVSHLKVELEENGEVIEYEIIKDTDEDENEQQEEVLDSEQSDHFKSIYGIITIYYHHHYAEAKLPFCPVWRIRSGTYPFLVSESVAVPILFSYPDP